MRCVIATLFAALILGTSRPARAGGVDNASSLRVCTFTVHAGEPIQAALRQAQPGSVICIAPGVYRESVGIYVSGTSEQPIVIKGIGGRPIIDGYYELPSGNNLDFSSDKLGCPGNMLVKNALYPTEQRQFYCSGYIPLVGIFGSNIIMENLEITRSTGIGIRVYSDKELFNIVIRNVYVHSVRLNGIDLHNVSQSKIEHNEVSENGNFAPFHRSARAMDWGGGVAAFGVHGAEFTANVIHNNWGDALVVDTNLGRSSDVRITNNVFYDNYSSNGVYAHAVRNVKVLGNLFYCSDHSDVFQWSSTLIAPSEAPFSFDIDTNDVVVSNNVFANCPNGGIVLWDTKHGTRTVSDVSLVNNTFVRNPHSITPSAREMSAFSRVRIDKNLVLDDREAAKVLVGGRNLIAPSAFQPGSVKLEWFRIKKSTGLGADIFRKSGAGLF